MFKKLAVSIAFLFISSITISQNNANEPITVANITEFNAAIKKATPGTKIILKNGEWKDVHLKAHGSGSKEAPIIITAETDGKVIITGDSKLNISGKYLIINGLWFKDGSPSSKSVIAFKKDSKDFASHCRLTNCTISNFNPTDTHIENHWVDIWGKNNRIDHNNFTGKTNAGTTLVVWLKGKEHTENNHQIDHNYFGKRPDLGKNGGETIRIGTSTNSMESSKTIVAFNTFKHCNGEIEIISNKSCDNIFRNNLFIESEGTLTLRHGNNALVENNVFIGNNKPRVGGIRIINEGHTVQNNFLISVIGKDYRAPIVVMNGVPNSPLNRYHQVKNVTIQNNTLINCSPVQFGAGKDKEKSLAPIHTVFANNLISNTNAGKISEEQDVVDGISFFGNIADSEAAINTKQFTKATVDWSVLGGLPMPTSTNNILKTAKRTDKSPEFDMVDSKRIEFVAGAFNLDNTILPKIITTKTGPFWKPLIADKSANAKSVANIINVEPGVETLGKAIKKIGSGGTLILSSGTYFVEKTMKIKGDVTIKGSDDKEKIIIKAADKLTKPLNYFIRIDEGGELQLENVTMDGESNSVKYALVSPEENMGKKYNLFVKNCHFKNFTNTNGGAVFKAYIGTLADTISIKNSIIEDSYRGLNLSYEKYPNGRYNAEIIQLHNTVFKDIKEFAVNYFRNGINPTNKGGELVVDHCVFSDVFNAEKGKVLKTNGINYVQIKNSVFENSYNIKNLLNLAGANNHIENCLIYNSGTVKISKGAKSNNLIYKSPKWEDHKQFIPGKKSALRKENNSIENIGLTF